MEKKPSSSDLLKIRTESQKKTDAARECLSYIKPMHASQGGIEKAMKEGATYYKARLEVEKEKVEVLKDIKTRLDTVIEKLSERVSNKRKRPRLSSSESSSCEVRYSPRELSPVSPLTKVPRSTARRPSSKGKCPVCQYTHQFEKCFIYNNCVSRDYILREKGLCVYCTGPINHCTSSFQHCGYMYRPCQHCQQPHLNALCPVKYPA